MKQIVAIATAGVWISLSEFLRNQVILIRYWENHYQTMHLRFPASPLNGALWVIWSFLFACYIRILTGKFSLIQASTIAWFSGFVLMWISIGNLGVLPLSILWIAVPLSIIECLIASLIIIKITNHP